MAASNEAVNPFVRRQQQRTLWIIVSVSLLLLFVAFGLIFYGQSQQSGILIKETSDKVTIRVNGKAVRGVEKEDGVYLPLSTGKYRIEIVKEGSLPFVQDVSTARGSITTLRPAYTLVASNSITSAKNLDYVRVSPDRKSVYYLGDNRTRLYRLEVANQVPVALTDRPLSSVLDVQWSNNPDVALIIRPDGLYLHEIPRFDFTSQKFDQIAGPEIVSPVWDPNNSDRLAFAISTDGGEQSIAIADKRLTTIQRLLFTERISEPLVQWSPNSAYLTITSRGGAAAQQNLYYLDLEATALVQISDSGSVRNSKISPDSKYILYEIQNGSTIERKLYDQTTQKTVSAGTGSIATLTWKDGSTFYEVASDGRTILQRTISGSSEPVAIALPGTDSIRELYFAKEPDSLIIRTDGGVFMVNVEE